MDIPDFRRASLAGVCQSPGMGRIDGTATPAAGIFSVFGSPAIGDPACLARPPMYVWIHRCAAQAEADLWPVGGVIAGLLQPFGEWPEDTIGPRLIVG